MTVQEELLREAALPNPAATQWVGDGKEALGTVCCYVPEELIHAAGLLPVRLRATGTEDDSVGKAYMSTYSCSYAHSSLQRLLDGTYDYLSGVISSDGCLMAERIYDNWRFAGDSHGRVKHLVNVPRKRQETSLAWLKEEFASLKQSLEDYTGKAITDDDLRASIELYNESRRLIRELYELQRDGQIYIKGSEVMRIVLAAMSMPKEQFNELLTARLEELRAAGPLDSDNVRVVFIGSALDDPSYIETIEEAGADVVMDMQCFGSRYLWEPVSTEGDLLANLAEVHLDRPTCPRMMDSHDRLYEFVENAVEDYRADGVIQVTMRYCDLWNGERLIFGKRFKEKGIPVLMLEREEIASNAGQLAVRVEAFVEMLEEEE